MRPKYLILVNKIIEAVLLAFFVLLMTAAESTVF